MINEDTPAGGEWTDQSLRNDLLLELAFERKGISEPTEPTPDSESPAPPAPGWDRLSSFGTAGIEQRQSLPAVCPAVPLSRPPSIARCTVGTARCRLDAWAKPFRRRAHALQRELTVLPTLPRPERRRPQAPRMPHQR